MYGNVQELLQQANHRGVALWEIILENECKHSQKSKEEVFDALQIHYEVMEQSAHKALEQPLQTAGSLITGIATTQHNYSLKQDSLCGGFINRVMALALSSSEVNASMGKICAAPTAGACGIVPAVLIGLREKYSLTLKQTLQGLLTASGIGAIIMKNATVAGSEAGCQAECGVAAAMAAAAAVELVGGSTEQAVQACSLALIHVMGLVCDPIAGLVQVPCAQRNASQAVNALLSADLALGGMQCIVPCDEVIDAMFRVGKMLPIQLRETAMGGIAATPTAKRINKNIFK